MKRFALSISVILLLVSNAYAVPITIDFDYSGGSAPGYFLVDDTYRGVQVADGPYPGGPWVQSFYESGVTFVNTHFDTSMHSQDGHGIGDHGAGQYGTFYLFWDSPIQDVTLNFCSADNGPVSLGVRAGDFHSWQDDMFISTISIAVSSTAQFSFVEISSYHTVLLDSLTFEGKEPIPEPATLILLSCGLCAVAGSRKFKFHKPSKC